MRARDSLATILILLVASMFAVGPGRGQAGAFPAARHALLIGNVAYPERDADLATPLGDLRILAETLRARGFAVETGENLTKERMQAAIERFVRKVEPGSIALVYFSGYGIQLARRNYLIPVDARIWVEADVQRDGIGIDPLLAELDGKGTGARVVVLDASRRNPFERRIRSFSMGLAETKPAPGLLALSSAAIGGIVGESGAGQSPFMVELTRQIGILDATAVQAFTATRDAVARDSRNQQIPALTVGPEVSFSFDSTRTKSDPLPGSKMSRSEDKTATAMPAAGSAPVLKPVDLDSGKPPDSGKSPESSKPLESGKPTDGKDIEAIVAAEEETARAFNRATRAGTKGAFEDFLAKHSTGALATVARSEVARLDRLRVDPPGGAKPAPVPAPSPAPGSWRSPPKPYSTLEMQRKTSLDARIARTPRDAAAYYERGQFHAQRDDYIAALADFDQAIRFDPKSPEAWNNRCWTRAVTNDLTQALSDCNESLRLRPNFVDALDSRGFVNLKSGALQAAVADYNAALTLVPSHSSALYGRGIARSRLGQRDQARDDLAEALTLNPVIDKDFAQYGLR